MSEPIRFADAEQLRGQMRALEAACALLIQQPVETLRGVTDLCARLTRAESEIGWCRQQIAMQGRRIETLTSDLRRAKRDARDAHDAVDREVYGV